MGKPESTESSPRQGLLGIPLFLFFLLYILLFSLVYISCFYNASEVYHIAGLIDAFKTLRSGNIGPELAGVRLGESDIRFGGPLFYLVHYMLMVTGFPPVSLNLLYYVLGLSVLCVWLHFGIRLFRKELVWCCGFFLAVSSLAKCTPYENNTFVAFFSLPLFLVFVSGLQKTSWKPMFLSGLILGLCTQFHFNTVAVIPALLLAIFLEDRKLLSQRMLVLTGTVLAAGILPAAAGMLYASATDLPRGQPGDLVRFVTGIFHFFNPRTYAEHIRHYLFDGPFSPFFLAGLIVTSIRLVRPHFGFEEGISTRRFSGLLLSWVTIPLLLLALYPNYMAYYYNIATPAKMVMTGIGFVQVHYLLYKTMAFAAGLFLFKKRAGFFSFHRFIFVILGAYSAYFTLLEGRNAPALERFSSGISDTRNSRCCDDKIRFFYSGTFFGFVRALEERNLFGPGASETSFYGIGSNQLNSISYWKHGFRQAAYDEGPGTGTGRHVFVGRHMATPIERCVQQAERFGPYIILPNVQPLPLRQHAAGATRVEYETTLPDLREEGPVFLVLVLEGQERFKPEAVHLLVDCRRLAPVEELACCSPEESGEEYFGQIVFFLRTHALKDKRLRLAVDHGADGIKNIQMVLVEKKDCMDPDP